jgi:chaperonin GroES
MQVRPLADRIVVRREPENAFSDGGLVLPETARKRAMAGTVLAVGPGVVVRGRRVRTEVEVGDRVLLTRWAGTDLGELALLLTEDKRGLAVVDRRDVLAVIGSGRVA